MRIHDSIQNTSLVKRRLTAKWERIEWAAANGRSLHFGFCDAYDHTNMVGHSWKANAEKSAFSADYFVIAGVFFLISFVVLVCFWVFGITRICAAQMDDTRLEFSRCIFCLQGIWNQVFYLRATIINDLVRYSWLINICIFLYLVFLYSILYLPANEVRGKRQQCKIKRRTRFILICYLDPTYIPT